MPYQTPQFESQSLPEPPPPIIVDGEEEFEVEEILDSRLHRGNVQYLMKWKGYPEAHNWT
jgi:hypothetical protein